MLPAAATTCNPVLVSLQAAHHAVLILLHVTEMSNEMCTEILGTESTESWSKEGESHHAEKNDIGGLALEAVLSFPYFQARRNDGRLRLSMPRSSPYNNNDNEEQEASDGEK
ncbi:hypothetical protein OIU78_001036, partial [Salix suchowensis]